MTSSCIREMCSSIISQYCVRWADEIKHGLEMIISMLELFNSSCAGKWNSLTARIWFISKDIFLHCPLVFISFLQIQSQCWPVITQSVFYKILTHANYEGPPVNIWRPLCRITLKFFHFRSPLDPKVKFHKGLIWISEAEGPKPWVLESPEYRCHIGPYHYGQTAPQS